MEINEYQKLAMTTLNRDIPEKEILVNALMGLCSESGEAIDLLKKHLFQGHDLDEKELKEELGDIAWYLAEAAEALNTDLDSILKGNIEKLKKRFPDGFEAERSIHRKEYRFHGWEDCDVAPVSNEYPAIKDPKDLYDILCHVWCAQTCAPRMRNEWSQENMTLGQCSITSFLVQDIFGGDVYGIPLEEGGFHCFNVVDGHVFDLTSEQFKEKLDYSNCILQSREDHFLKEEKYQRYLLLKERMKEIMKGTD